MSGPSLFDFNQWLDTKNFGENYNYYNCDRCAVGQYYDERKYAGRFGGLSSLSTIQSYREVPGIVGQLETLAYGDGLQTDHTFGRLKGRVIKALQDA